MEDRNVTADLVRKAQSGDSAAFNQLFNSCYNDIYYFALKTVKKDDLAYDITQEACMDIFKNISSLQDPNMFVAWSKRITYNRCAQYFRKNQEILIDENEDGSDMFDALEDDDRDFIPDEALDRDDFRKTIMDMINGLSEEQRTAVMLYYFDELSVGEIAQIQGVSEGTVKSRLNYARKSIKSAVEDYEEKNNVKLHSFGLLPLLLWLRGGDLAGLSIPSAGAALQGTVSSAASTISASAAAATATTAATSAAATGAATVASAASKGVLIKVIAAVAAAAIVIGGGTVAYKVMSEKAKEKEASQTTEETVSESVETTENQADANRNERPEYASQHLEIYGSSFDNKDQIVKYITSTASYFVTEDGKVYNTFDPTEPIYQARSADDVYCTYNGISYVDENGNLISEFIGTEHSLEGIEGEIVAVLSTGWFNNICDVITKDSNGNYFYTSYGEADPTPVYGPLPIRVYNEETAEEIGNIVDIEPYYDSIYDTDETYIVTENMIYVADSYGKNEAETEIIFNVKPVTDTVGGLIESNESEDDHSPFYFKNPDDTTFYRHTLGTLTYGESEYQLPEGYTASQLERVVTAYHTWILVFDDGSVYTYGGMYETTYSKLEYLSDLYKDGHIVDIFTEGQSLISEDFDIIVHMDDGGLYVYRD